MVPLLLERAVASVRQDVDDIAFGVVALAFRQHDQGIAVRGSAQLVRGVGSVRHDP